MHSGSGRRNSERILGCTLTRGCGHNRTENFGNLITAPCGLLLKVSSEGGCGRSGSQCAQPQLAAAGRRKRRRKREAQRGAGGPYGCFLLCERDYRYMVGDQPKYLRRGSLYENIPCQAKLTSLFNLSQDRVELIKKIFVLSVPIERG